MKATNNKFIRHVKHTSKQDIQIFILPYKGALRGIRKEFTKPMLNKSFSAIAVKSMRLLLAPFVGIVEAYRTDLEKIFGKN